MKMRQFHACFAVTVLACGGASVHGQAPAPASCPWLTQGMAARVLGGDVTVQVQVSDAGEGICSFVRTSDAMTSLRIEVSKATLPACGADGMRLKGIGNEAVRCALPAAGGSAGEKIAGRVRDRNFTLTMRFPGSATAKTSVPSADDDLEQAAESVAGNLF